MKTTTVLAALAGIAAVSVNVAHAQSTAARDAAYPTRAVRMIVPYPAGGGTDVLARLVTGHLTEAWKQSVVIDNRSGGSTVIGTELVVKGTPDGYTLLLTSSVITVNHTLAKKLPYDVTKDLVPITLIAASPNMLLVHPSVPANTLNELITYAKSRPGQLNYASTGNGGTGHLAMEMLKAMAGLQITHIPFKGGAPAMLAQLSGEVPLGFNNVVAAMPHVKAGKLRALGVTGAKRLSLTPDLPTIAEAGVAGFEAVAWFGTFAPPGTPAAITRKIHQDTLKVMELKSVREQFANQGADAGGAGLDEFKKIILADIARWAKVIKFANIQAD